MILISLLDKKLLIFSDNIDPKNPMDGPRDKTLNKPSRESSYNSFGTTIENQTNKRIQK